MSDKEKEKESVVKTAVVVELPQQPYNQVETENGDTVKLVTISDALTEILESVREMKRAGLY